MSRAARAANRYARMEDRERCAAAGRLMREAWYAYVYRPDRYEALLAARMCARPDQIPAWVYADIDDPERIPESLRRDEQYVVRTQVALGGRGAGKTIMASRWFLPELLERPGYRLEILGPDFKVAVGVGIKGRSGIKTLIEALDKSLIKRFDEVKNILYLVNESIVICRSSENPGSIEGEEFHGLWVDEPAELLNQGGEECIYRKRAEPGIRLIGDNGEPARKIVTGTPEATPLIRDLYKSARRNPRLYAWTELRTRDNIVNLDPELVEQMYEEGSPEFVASKLDGKLRLSSPHALLQDEHIEAVTLTDDDIRHREVEDVDSVILAVDTQSAEDKASDECGIIVLGVSDEPELSGKVARRARIFADASCSGGSRAWGERIIEVLEAYPEIREVCVENDGFAVDVVERVLGDAMERLGRPVRIKRMRHRNKSKKVRADPVAGLYQVKRVYHDPSCRTPQWASMERLGFQWVSWNPKFTGKHRKSPDRVDAVVYGVTRLLLRERQPDQFYAASDVTWA